MGLNTKWIDSRPDDSAEAIARRALKRRLARMSHYLERAVCEPQHDTEYVHQLRVFARRAAAAVEIFADFLPKKRRQKVEKQVRCVRKAAGEARDLDVLLMRWTEHMRRAPSSHAALLLEQVKRHRQQAQEPIEAVYKKLLRRHFKRRTRKLLARVRLRGQAGKCGQRFGCVARVELGRLVLPYLAASHVNLDDTAATHAFRIMGKQVRYAMEIFAGAFDEPFRKDLYPIVAALQERLGAINDHVAAQIHFANWLAEVDSCSVREALEMGIQCEGQALAASRREFVDWWTTARREDLARRFAAYVDLEATPSPAPGVV
jgi:CHAD domain-containing protein